MSKMNPQKATAYVGPGVLRKGGNITKVPNGPLVKKKGPFKGSTLKTGGAIKKAQVGDTLTVKKPMTYAEKRAAQEIVKQQNREKLENNLNRNAAAKGMTREEMSAWQKKNDRKPDAPGTGEKRSFGKEYVGCAGSERERARRLREEARRKNGGPIKKETNTVAKDKTSTGLKRNVAKDVSGERILTAKKNRNYESSLKDKATQKRKEATNADMLSTELIMSDNNFNRSKIADKLASERRKSADSLTTVAKKNKVNPKYKSALKNGGPVKKAKAGAMIKRADGSMSRRGLWDNLRSKAAQNKKTGAKPKVPSKAMLTQEKKIKAKGK